MAQSTLDAFITKPKDPFDVDAATEDHQDAGSHGEDAPAPKGVPRLHVAGTSTVCRAIEAVRAEHPEAERRPRDAQLAAQPQLRRRPGHRGQRAARRRLRPAPAAQAQKEGRAQGAAVHPSLDELIGLISVGEEIVDLLLDDERAHVVVMDGYPQGQIYARFAACIAARCLKLRRASKEVTMPRATTPADAVCKAALKRFKSCRSVEKMRAAAEAYYHEELADRFP